MILSDLVARLAALDIDTIARASLQQQGDKLAEQVRVALSTGPGGSHDHPWRQTGALHDSIGCLADGEDVVIGSASDVALYQEHGTPTVPPRPTFGPIAAEQGEAIAAAIAITITQAIRSA